MDWQLTSASSLIVRPAHLLCLSKELARPNWNIGLEAQTRARNLALLVQQFEDDRIELYRVVLGDVCHACMRFHAQALRTYSVLLPECEYLSPSNIEAETGFKQLRVVAEAAATVLGAKKKQRETEQERQDTENEGA